MQPCTAHNKEYRQDIISQHLIAVVTLFFFLLSFFIFPVHYFHHSFPGRRQIVKVLSNFFTLSHLTLSLFHFPIPILNPHYAPVLPKPPLRTSSTSSSIVIPYSIKIPWAAAIPAFNSSVFPSRPSLNSFIKI